MILVCRALLSSCPLANPALGTDGRHDSAQKDQQDFAKNNPKKKMCLLGQNNSSSKDFCKNKDRKYHNLVLKSSTTNTSNMADISSS
jgi:hypothetical protein